jgi:hypothetical protein
LKIGRVVVVVDMSRKDGFSIVGVFVSHVSII